MAHRYQLISATTTTLRQRPAIACALVGILLVMVAFVIGGASVKHSDNTNTAIVPTPEGKEGIEGESKPKDDKEKSAKSQGLFETDPPGLDAPTQPRHSIWQYEISLAVNNSRTVRQRTHPSIAFIKGLKVGGTSVALALDGAARRYNIKLQSRINEARNRMEDPGQPISCTEGGSLWFHHGYKHEWIKLCMPHVRFTTLLREPISQTLSWEAMGLSHAYYQHYPRKDCNESRTITIRNDRNPAALRAMLKEIDHCVDAPYRKNLTLMLVAHAVDEFKLPAGEHNGFPGMAVALTTSWITGNMAPYGRMTGKRYIKFLEQNYFLVGVTDRLNEFLVLLGLHMGWDLSSLYYIYCKPTTSDVHHAEFAHYFPELMPKLEKSTTVVREAYLWAKQQFDDHVDQLGPWFKETVRKFEEGLKDYQEKNKDPERPFQWKTHSYLDHHKEDC